MLAPCVFTQTTGKAIAIDACDVCSVAETDDGVQIQYMPTNDPDIIVVKDNFDDVLTKLNKAQQQSLHHEPRDGDEWKYGDGDEGESDSY